MNENDLKEVLKLHSMWLNDRSTGKGADLTGADLRGADLREANLRGADLTGAYLTGADLQGAYLTGADLTGADLQGADLREANLRGADLYGTNLKGANLRGADLTGADLTGADLTGADLTGADLTGAKLPMFQLCPDGQFTGYKKVAGGTVLELLVPRSALRTSSLVGRKCRASKVKVVGVVGETPTTQTVFKSTYGSSFVYEVGTWVSEPNYDEDIRVECTKGIHFFITKAEALAY